MTSGNNQGWIKLNRSILDSAIFKDSEIYHIYSYLLLKANHKDNEFIFNGKNETCKRGQLITGIFQISKDTGINRGKVDRTLKYLETVKQIVKQSNSKFSLITMLTYEDDLESVNQNVKPVGNECEASVNKQEGKEGKEGEVAPLKKNFSSEGNQILLTQEEYNRLVEDYGLVAISKVINNMSLVQEKKWKKYKYVDFNKAIRKWLNLDGVVKNKENKEIKIAKETEHFKAIIEEYKRCGFSKEVVEQQFKDTGYGPFYGHGHRHHEQTMKLSDELRYSFLLINDLENGK